MNLKIMDKMILKQLSELVRFGNRGEVRYIM